jgi:Rps23 Pro-64 3,4-dihydroxylase Tpa1-like proline 4-hydroxylase
MAPTLVKASTQPFQHFILSDFYETDFAGRLSDWLLAGATWRRAVHHFYDQFELSFRDAEAIPDNISARLLSDLALGNVKTLAEELFQVRLRPNIALSAHKLVDGQGIGIHTDNAPHAETHRIVVQLSRDWKDVYGGQLVFFGSGDIEDVKTVFKHAFNTAIAFPLDAVSYHAVTDVSDAERLTVIYGFWSFAADFSPETAARTFDISQNDE